MSFTVVRLWVVFTTALIFYFWFVAGYTTELNSVQYNANITTVNGTYQINETATQDVISTIINTFQIVYDFNSPIGILNIIITFVYLTITGVAIRELVGMT